MGNIQYSQQAAQQKHVPIWVNVHESWSYAKISPKYQLCLYTYCLIYHLKAFPRHSLNKHK